MFSFRIFCLTLCLCVQALLVNGQGIYTVDQPANQQGISAVPSANGYFILTQQRNKEITGDDIRILEISLAGEILNDAQMSWLNHQYAQKLITTSDNGLLVVGSSWMSGGRLNAVVVKFNAQLEQQWSVEKGGSARDEGFSIIETLNGDFVLCGMTKSTGGRGDIWLIRMDNTGQTIWEKSFGPASKDYGFDLVELSDGTLVVGAEIGGHYGPSTFEHTIPSSGIYLYGFNPSGDQLWKQDLSTEQNDQIRAMVKNSDDQVYVIGATQSQSAGSFDMLVIQTDADGNELFRQTYGGAGFDVGSSISLTNSESLMITGYSEVVPGSQSTDVAVAHLDAQGNPYWMEHFGQSQADKGAQILPRDDGTSVVIGSTVNEENNELDVYVITLDTMGDPIGFQPFTNQITTSSAVTFPNPTTGRITFMASEGLITQQSELTLFDAAGNVVASKSGGSSLWRHDFSHLTNGSYHYRIETPGGSPLKGIIVKY